MVQLYSYFDYIFISNNNFEQQFWTSTTEKFFSP